MDDLMFVKSLSCECLHKVRVINPFTKEVIMVPCGTCPACLYRKSVQSEIKTKAQRAISKHCYFVSLSYNVYNCPSYRIEETSLDGDSVKCVLRDSGLRDSFLRQGHPLASPGFSMKPLDELSFVCKRDYLERYKKQADLARRKNFFDPRFHGTYGYLKRDDLTLFMKRFRKYLYKLSNCYERIHTYFVGEYGSVHFRPHFHLLFFFDSDRLAANIIESCNRAWKFGRVDISEDRGKSAAYVAGYLNSFTFLPLHLRQLRSIRPFGRFSNKFGQSLFKDSIEKGKQGDFSDFFIGKSVSVCGRSVTVLPWRSVTTSCFFYAAKLRGATVSTLVQLLYSTHKLLTIPALKGLKTLYSRARKITEFFCNGLIPDSPDLKFLSTFLNDFRLSVWKFNFREYFDRFHQFLYRHFLDCERFLNTYEKTLFSLDFKKYDLYLPLLNSIHFYHEQSRKNYQIYCENRRTYPGVVQRYFFCTTEEEQRQFCETSLGKRLLQFQKSLVYNRVKHREINEKNRFFVSV